MPQLQKPPDLDDNLNPIKPPDLDGDGNPIELSLNPEDQVAEIAPEEEPEVTQNEPNLFQKTWGAINTSLVDTRHGLSLNETPFGKEHPYISKGLDFGMDALSGLTSPLNVATGAFGLGETALAGKAPAIARALGMGRRGLSAGVAAEGASNIIDAEQPSDLLTGGIELAGGLAGLKKGLPTKISEVPPVQDIIPETGVKPQFNPKGQIGQTGTQQTARMSAKVTVKQPTPELVQRLKNAGYRPAGVNDEGYPIMIRGDIPDTPVGDISLGKPSLFKELYNAPRGLMSVDLPFITSAALRQGLPFIGTKQWFQAWGKAAKSYGSELAYHEIMGRIEQNPLFQATKDLNFKNGKWVATTKPSFAERAGLRMTDLKSFTNQEENIAGKWLEKIPGYGKHVAGSNRAYTAFLNHIRATTFDSLMQDLGAGKDLTKASAIAEFINDATGRGTMKLQAGKHTYSLEQHAKGLADIFFSPRLMASRVNMMNPSTYIMAQPGIRKEYIKAGLRTGGAWLTFAGLAKMAGADVSLDSNSSDFGKIKIGNTRIDPAGGFQQFAVLLSRLATQKTTSSTSGREYEFGQGYKPETAGSTVLNFFSNKLHPSAKLVYDAFFADEQHPLYVGDRVAQMFLPMFMNDITEVAQEDPRLLPLILPLTNAGMGSQTYDRGVSKPSLTPLLGLEDMDLVIGGQK